MKRKFLQVRELAEARGIDSPLELMYRSRISQQTAYAIWADRQTRVDERTLLRLSDALGVPIGELFANNMGKKGNGGENSKNGNVVESEDNKVPALIGNLTTQSARGTNVIPAFADSLTTEQTRVPYRKAA